MHRISIMCGTAMLAALVISASAPSRADDSAIPNLMSAEFGWQVSSGLNYLRVPGTTPPIGRGTTAASGERLADTGNANLTAWASDRMRARNDLVTSGHRAFTAQSRCWPGGVPGQLLFIANPIYFIQGTDEVWIVWERDHHVRRIYLNREHSKDLKPSWFGESVGHYENGELVIDTVGLNENEYSVVDNFDTPHTKDIHVVERWKIADGGALEARVTVDDPGAFKTPWTGMVRWEKVMRPMEEWVCAENNLGYEELFKLPEYPMPTANTPDF